MSRQFTRDFYLEVMKGNISNHESVLIRGHNNSLSTTRLTITPTLSAGSIDQSGIASVPATVRVASTSTLDTAAGTGLRTMTLIGRSSTGAEQTETITMNGQTSVVSTKTYRAITGWTGLTWGTVYSNAGTIWVGAGTFTAGVPATKYFAGDVGVNIGNTAYYVVPLNKTLYLRQALLTVGITSRECSYRIDYSTAGQKWINHRFWRVSSSFTASLLSGRQFIAGTHVRVTGQASAAATEVAVDLDGVLVS